MIVHTKYDIKITIGNNFVNSINRRPIAMHRWSEYTDFEGKLMLLYEVWQKRERKNDSRIKHNIYKNKYQQFINTFI